ncbi:MAG: DUF2110 family protein [Methanosarcinaceae archaeon]|nr:DUF2110 family protein [Methanosarcinaceae archaeon]
MKTIILLLHIYGNRERAIRSIEAMVNNELKELDAIAHVSTTENEWARVDIAGEDEEFSANLLLSRYGSPVEKVDSGNVYRGYIQSISDDSLLVNVGTLVSISIEELKPLGMGQIRQIASRFGIISHLPVSVEINGKKKARFTKEQVDLFWRWKKSGTDRVIANSVTRSELKAVIKKTGHSRDIYGIERIGVMEHAIVCRENTDGPGIVAEIGPLLKSEIGVVIGSG